jgi:hypothetical protein
MDWEGKGAKCSSGVMACYPVIVTARLSERLRVRLSERDDDYVQQPDLFAGCLLVRTLLVEARTTLESIAC